MHLTSLSLRLRTGWSCALASLVFPVIRAAAADAPSEADAFPTFESYIKVSGEAPFMTGDTAAFATRNAVSNSTGSYGIEDLFYTKDVNDSTTVKINGKVLYGADDYLGSIDVKKDDVGSIDVGYKRFRTFYDGVGGFFPLTDLFERVSPESLHVDRSSFWFDLKLARPDSPVFTLGFHDDIRTGQKDSTEWAAIVNPEAVVVSGALVGTAAPSNTPLISPNIYALAEHHKTLDGTMAAVFGKTTETLKATFEWINNLDTRYYVKYPNSNVIVDPPVSVLGDQESNTSKSFRVLDQTDTPINGWLAFDAGFTYRHLSGEDGGEWITPAYNATAGAVFSAQTAGNITADPKLDDFVGNASLKFTPTKDWLAEAGFRQEYNVISDSGGFIVTSLAAGSTSTAGSNVTTATDVTRSHNGDHVASPEVSLQYLGFERLSLYLNADKRIDRGTQNWINPYAASTTAGITGLVTTANASLTSVYFQQANQDNENLKAGANWNASSQITLRVEIFRKDHENRFIGSDAIVGTGSYGGIFATGYTFTGLNVSLICKPVPELSLSTLYQPQSGDMSVLGNAPNDGNGTEVTSGKARSQRISETLGWTPYRQLYFQGNINVVYDYLQTTYPLVVVSTTANVPAPVGNANNNYITSSALCGFVVDKDTDAQIQASWQQATNYNPQVALGGQAYGATFMYETLTVGVKHKFTKRFFGDAKVGYMKSTNATTGGFTNYSGPLAYLSATYSL